LVIIRYLLHIKRLQGVLYLIYVQSFLKKIF